MRMLLLVTSKLQLLLFALPVEGEAGRGSEATPQHLLVGLTLLTGARCLALWRTAAMGSAGWRKRRNKSDLWLVWKAMT